MASVLAAAVATRAASFPPPAPPEYVHRAAQVLAGAPGGGSAAAGPLFGADVQAFYNGRLVAQGLDAWTAYARKAADRPQRTVIGRSEAAGGGGDDAGELLVVDMVDTVDRADLPPTFIADPRLTTRAILYRFGADGLIHTVRIVAAAGFWEGSR